MKLMRPNKLYFPIIMMCLGSLVTFLFFILEFGGFPSDNAVPIWYIMGVVIGFVISVVFMEPDYLQDSSQEATEE